MPPRAPSSEAGRAKPGARELERQLGKSLRKAPFRNGPDLDDLPDEVREAMTVRLVRDVEEVLDRALAPRPDAPLRRGPSATARKSQ